MAIWRVAAAAIMGALALALASCTGDDSPTPTASDLPAGKPGVTLAGDPELVYSWTDDRCSDAEVPDLPVRAIRAADGTVSLYMSSTTNYRMAGPSLDDVAVDCDPVLTSSFDIDPATFNNMEWMGAPYTTDGTHVTAIIHNEFHGDKAGDRWSSVRDFAGKGQETAWGYSSRTSGGLKAMKWNAKKNQWEGPSNLCLIYRNGQHPDVGCNSVRTWTSPVDGSVVVSFHVWDDAPNVGDGVKASIARAGKTLWGQNLPKDGTQLREQITVDVSKGDVLEFAVDAKSTALNDATGFEVNISPGGPICASGDSSVCTLISLTQATSTDGGATFTQADPPALIAAPAYAYDPEWFRAVWQPSNIVLNPADGYYYALVQRDDHNFATSVHEQGTCVMRTTDPADAASWRAWDGTAFAMQFVDPFTTSPADAAAQECALVSPAYIGALTYSLTYNEYLGRFVAVGVAPSPKSGFYVSYSEDLVHWSPRELVFEAPLSFTVDAPPYYAYPSVLDPASTSHELRHGGADGVPVLLDLHQHLSAHG